MHEVRRMVATLREIFMNRLFSKSYSSELIIACALNRLPRIFCDFYLKKSTVEVRLFYFQTANLLWTLTSHFFNRCYFLITFFKIIVTTLHLSISNEVFLFVFNHFKVYISC